jgi:hypothetical protein
LNGLPLNELILSSVDEGLESVGASAKSVIYSYLAQNEKMKPEDIAANCALFVKTLHRLFGPGSLILERNIIALLGEKTGRADLPRELCKALADLTKHET